MQAFSSFSGKRIGHNTVVDAALRWSINSAAAWG